MTTDKEESRIMKNSVEDIHEFMSDVTDVMEKYRERISPSCFLGALDIIKYDILVDLSGG